MGHAENVLQLEEQRSTSSPRHFILKINPLRLPTPVLLLLAAVLMLGINACQSMTITMS